MTNIVVYMNPTSSDIKALLSAGKSVAGFSGYFEIPREEIHKNKDKSHGIPIADGYTTKLRDISTCLESKDKTRCAIKIKYDSPYNVVREDNTASFDKLDTSVQLLNAMVAMYGVNCIKNDSDIDMINTFIPYVLPTKSYIEGLTKAALQSFYESEKLSIANINWTKTKAENLSLILAYYGY